MNIKELLERRSELKRQGNALWEKAMTETAQMTVENKEAYMVEVRKTNEQIMRDLDDLDEQIKAATRFQEQEREEIRQTVARETADPRKSRSEFNNFGQFLQAIACHSSNIIAGSFSPSYREELHQKLSLYQAAASGMSVSSPPDGGFLVRKDWTSEFLTRAMQASILRPMCTRVGIGADFDSLEYPYIDESSRATGSRFGGVQVFWRAEAATVAAKAPKIGKGELKLEEIVGLAYATDRLLRDATALGQVLSISFESEFGFKLDDAIMRGNGAGQMLGFLSSDVLVSVTRAVDDIDTLLDAYSRMPPRLLAGSVWLYHTAWIKKLPKMKIGDTPVWVPPGTGMVDRPRGSILGQPAMPIEQCSAVGTAGDLNFVNLGEYLYIEKDNEGMRFDQSLHVKFVEGETAFRWSYRINGQPVARTSLAPYTGSDALSPFVTVAA